MQSITFPSGDRTLAGALFEPEAPTLSAVVFCHGAFEFKENWFDYARRLAERGLAALTFDFTGHGDSTGVRGTVDMPVWTTDVHAALTELQCRGYERLGLVGWSSGGSAVILVAADDPRVSCAVALDATVQLIPPLSERIVYSLLSGLGRVKKALTGKPLTVSLVGELEKMTVAVDSEVNRRFKNDQRLINLLSAGPMPGCLATVWCDVTGAARRIRVPFAVIHGQEDQLDLPHEGELLYELLSGEKALYLIEGSGHAGHLDQKRDEIFELMAGWFATHLACAPA